MGATTSLMTFEDFERLPDEPGKRELLNGELIELPHIGFNDPGRSIPYVWQYSAGFQYEIAPGTVIEATYSGSQTHALQVSRNLNVLSEDQLALGTFYLNQGVPNPVLRRAAAQYSSRDQFHRAAARDAAAVSAVREHHDEFDELR